MLEGIDVSHWNGAVNWQTAKAAGAAFAYLKATQGLSYKDETYRPNNDGALAAGVLRGAYHFYDYRQYGAPQARWFWGVIKSAPGELPPVMDLELYWTPYPSGKNLLAATKDFITELDSLSGRKTMLYTNPAMIQLWGTIPQWLMDHPLFVAHYGVTQPSFRPWPDWTIWQTSGTGSGKKYGCASAGVDLDLFNGDMAQLRAFCGLGVVTPPVPELTLEQRVTKLEADMLAVLNAAEREGWKL
jgi:lysozyme